MQKLKSEALDQDASKVTWFRISHCSFLVLQKTISQISQNKIRETSSRKHNQEVRLSPLCTLLTPYTHMCSHIKNTEE